MARPHIHSRNHTHVCSLTSTHTPTHGCLWVLNTHIHTRTRTHINTHTHTHTHTHENVLQLYYEYLVSSFTTYIRRPKICQLSFVYTYVMCTQVTVGEWKGHTLNTKHSGGISCSPELQSYMQQHFKLHECIDIPRWPCRCDVVMIWRR